MPSWFSLSQEGIFIVPALHKGMANLNKIGTTEAAEHITQGLVVGPDLEIKGETHVNDLIIHGEATGLASSADLTSLESDIQEDFDTTNAAVVALDTTVDGHTSTLASHTSTLSTHTSQISTANTNITTNTTAIANLPGSFTTKLVVDLASTAPLGTLTGFLVVDGVTTTAGMRVLVKDQFSTGRINNGIWVVAAGAWTRAWGSYLDATEVDVVFSTGWVDINGSINCTDVCDRLQAGATWTLTTTNPGIEYGHWDYTEQCYDGLGVPSGYIYIQVLMGCNNASPYGCEWVCYMTVGSRALSSPSDVVYSDYYFLLDSNDLSRPQPARLRCPLTRRCGAWPA